MKKFISLLLTLFFLSLAVGLSQECAIGTNVHQRLNFQKATVISHPGGRFSPTRKRYSAMTVKRNAAWANPFQGSGRRSKSPDFPLERAAILAMSGVGVGFFTGDTQVGQQIGLPAIAVAIALPFPGEQRRGRFYARRRIGQKLLGLVAFTTAYSVGLGVGNALHMDSPTQ